MGKQYNRSTIILGDSNTRHLKFGTGNGTFGFNMPGKGVYAPLIDQINPSDCIGYNNIILHCGVNNIKKHGENISVCADKLIHKVESIRSLCPRSKITVNPILPSKSDVLNTKSKEFNSILFDYIDAQPDRLIRYLNFNVFVDTHSDLLSNELGRFNSYDTLHLGSSGIRLLVKLIKERVCGNRVDGRPYAGVGSVNRASVNRESGKRRLGNMSMMNTATSSFTFPALSQQTQP